MFTSDEALKKAIVDFYNDSVENDKADEYFEEFLTLVDDGDWVDDGKYSYKETVYKLQTVGKPRYFSVCSSRSGSYFTDYDYGDDNIYEVEPVEIVKTEYHVIH